MHGATKVVLLFTSTLQKKGHQNTIYCLRFNIERPFWFEGGIKPFLKKRIKVTEKSGISKLISIVGQILGMIFLPFFIPRDTDVIVFHSEESSFSLPLAKFLFRKKKLVYYCYQVPRELYDRKGDTKKTYGIWYWFFAPFFALYKVLHKWLVSLADDVLVWSPQAKKQADELLGHFNYHVIPAGVDFTQYELDEQKKKRVEELRSILKLDGQKVLLMNAALVAKKNIPHFLRLIRKLLDQNIPVHGLIIGEGPEKEMHENTMSELGIENHFTLLGHVSQEDLPLYYFLCDCLLYLEFDGPWTMSIIEAGAARKPVVVCSGGSMETLASHERTGFIMNNLDDQLEGFVAKLLKDPQLSHEMGENNYQHSKQFSTDASIDNFLKVV